MSNLYNLEPQPTAKVVLQTTSGDLSFELFAKQTPLASRNFLQHCLDGYYNGTIFHRLVPNFILQGGDPRGDGAGGESAINNGEPFADEFHSRLKYNRRGLLGMANEGKDGNGSQFFITLAATPELQGKNTLFGRIEGDTIYNLMKMAEAELVDGSERPLYPTKITGAEVLVNPFEDMVARVKEAPRAAKKSDGGSLKKRKKPAGKNVLSFGVDADADDLEAPVLKKSKANPKLVSINADTVVQSNGDTVKKPAKVPAVREQLKTRRSPSPSEEDVESEHIDEGDKLKSAPPVSTNAKRSPSSSPEPERNATKQSALEKTNAEIAALKASMKRQVERPVSDNAKPKSALEAMIPATSSRGRKRGKVSDEKGALDMFKAFKERLKGFPNEHTSESPDEPLNGNAHNAKEMSKGEPVDTADDEADLCDLHFIANCQSCKSWDAEKPDDAAEADGNDDLAWMSHKLTFAKDTLGKNLEWKKKMEEIDVIDPRDKAKTIKDERRRGKRH